MKERLHNLFARHLERRLTTPERLELLGLCLEPSLQADLQQLLENVWETTGEDEGLTEDEVQQLLKKAANQPRTSAVIKMSPWKKWMVAASILLVIAMGYWVLVTKENKSTAFTNVPADVNAPATNRAMITLADGSKIYLDSAGDGQLAVQGNVKLMKLDNGQIAYHGESSITPGNLVYNTLSNPRGSKVVDMTLADGSRVWLNAGSSVRYPVTFLGDERKVSITGEAYFEITHDASKPFKVYKGETEIEVLGTHFNVNAYDENANMKVTLLEGSVKVKNEHASGVLKPGQQAQVGGTGVTVINDVDIEQVMAWKNGMFLFKRSNIAEIMQQVERWYNVDVDYQVKTDKLNFSGVISRKENVSGVLKIMELTGLVHFTISGNRITVQQ